MCNRAIYALLAIAVAVSVVHYVDNVTAFETYPESDSLPNPSQGLIAFAWFFFSAFAIAAVYFLGRGRDLAAGIALAVYSGSGLVGVGHYAAGGTGDFPWWRHAHIATDIVLGVAMLAVAVHLARRASTQVGTPAAPSRPT